MLWILCAGLGFAAAFLYSRLSARHASPAYTVAAVAPSTRIAQFPPITQRSESSLSGRARVIDGDSMHVGPAEVRLHGIDAPEGVQTCLNNARRWPCGRRAAQALRGLVEGREVACDERDRDRYGRVVAVCWRGSVEVNAWLVANGWAMAYRRHSRAYIDEESAAEAGRRGIWSGEFEPPWDWREGERLRAAAPEPASATAGLDRRTAQCNIKGNISHNSGKRLYHIPGDPDYANTRISAARGERWFCSEAAARAAGWRRAGR